MKSTNPHAWAIVLAGGSGRRLEALTTNHEGRAVPKQYCSLRGGRSLFGDALARARSVIDDEQVMTVVSAEHRRWFERETDCIVPGGVIVQPQNRGTAAGILLPLLAVHERDPFATVVLLPSDHHVRRECVLADAIDDALDAVDTRPDRVVLLGMQPDSPQSDYGWIVPSEGSAALRSVERFVEKPEPRTARALMDSGGLWNTFVLVGRVGAFLDLFARHQPVLLAALEATTALPASARSAALTALYGVLPVTDFSRDVLQAAVDRLDVLEVSACGWTDRGTPERVAERLEELEASAFACHAGGTSVLDLHQTLGALSAAAHAR